jgi:hypothetical protein
MNTSLPLPGNISGEDVQVLDSVDDSPSRKAWRMRECNDFKVIMKQTLKVVYANISATDDNVTQRKELGKNSWVIFNQDDGVWKLPFKQLVHKRLSKQLQRGIPVYYLHHASLVSMAFQVNYLENMFDYYMDHEFWCDFKPMDWVVLDYVAFKGIPEEKLHAYELEKAFLVKHIGRTSSRQGYIDAAVELVKQHQLDQL